MASKVEKSVSIIFEGENRVGKSIMSVSNDLDKLGSKVQGATQPLADMARNILQVEAALAALAVGGLALAVKSAGEFGDGFAEITTLIDKPVESLGQFRTGIIDYARDSRASIEDINQAVYEAISTGTDYSRSLDLLSDAERLSIAGKAELADTIVLLAGTMNAYGAGTDQAQRYSDAFFQTVKLGKTTIPELAESLAQVTGAAAATNVPVETLMSALAALTASGQPTTQAITGIKGALNAIIKPSSQAEAMAKKLGIEFGIEALKAKGFEGVLNEVYDATGGNVSQMSRLFGRVEALNAVTVLAADKTGKFKGALEAMQSATGSTDAAYQKMADNFALTNQRLINNLQATMIDVGTPLLNEYGDIADGLVDIFKGLSVGIDAGAFEPVFEMLETFAGDVADFLAKVAENMPEILEGLDFTGFVDSIRGLGTEVRGALEAFFGVDLSTTEGISRAIQKIIDSMSALTNVTGGIISAWEPFLEILGKAVEKFADADEGTAEMTGKILGFGQVVNKVASNIGILTGAMNVIAWVMSLNFAKGILSSIGGMKKLKTVAVGAAGPLKALGAVGVAAGVGWTIGTVLRELFPVIDKAAQKFWELTDSVLNFTGTQGRAVADMDASREKMAKIRQGWAEYKATLEGVPDKIKTEIILEATGKDADQVKALLTGENAHLFADQVVAVTVEADPVAIAETKQTVQELVGYIGDEPIYLEVDANQASILAAEQKLKELEKPIEIQTKLDIANIEAETDRLKIGAETMQELYQIKASVDIAEIDAATERVKAAFASIDNTITSTGDVISSLFGTMNEAGSISDKWRIKDAISQEQERRDKALQLQKSLVESQIKLNDTKASQIAQGGSMISVSADGLEPELQAFMWKILEQVQVRAIADDSEFLLGL